METLVINDSKLSFGVHGRMAMFFKMLLIIREHRLFTLAHRFLPGISMSISVCLPLYPQDFKTHEILWHYKLDQGYTLILDDD